jgi:hypothetical protein
MGGIFETQPTFFSTQTRLFSSALDTVSAEEASIPVGGKCARLRHKWHM